MTISTSVPKTSLRMVDLHDCVRQPDERITKAATLVTRFLRLKKVGWSFEQDHVHLSLL